MTSNKTTDDSTCHSLWMPSPVSHCLPVVLRRAVWHPPKSRKFPRRRNESPAERSRSLRLLPPVPTAKNRLFFLGFQVSYSCRRRATAVSLLARQDDVRPGIPRLSRRSLRSLATARLEGLSSRHSRTSCALPIGMPCAIRLSMSWRGCDGRNTDDTHQTRHNAMYDSRATRASTARQGNLRPWVDIGPRPGGCRPPALQVFAGPVGVFLTPS